MNDVTYVRLKIAAMKKAAEKLKNSLKSEFLFYNGKEIVLYLPVEYLTGRTMISIGEWGQILFYRIFIRYAMRAGYSYAHACWAWHTYNGQGG